MDLFVNLIGIRFDKKVLKNSFLKIFWVKIIEITPFFRIFYINLIIELLRYAICLFRDLWELSSKIR